jgi:hypothetical protein
MAPTNKQENNMWRTFAAISLATSMLVGATNAFALGAGGAGGGGAMGGGGTSYGTSTMPNYVPPRSNASGQPVKHVKHKNKHNYVQKP